MSNLNLSLDEEIIAQDEGVQVRGPLHHSVDLILTTKRFFVIPRLNIDKLAGASKASLILKKIDRCEKVGSQYRLEDHKRSITLIGNGAERMFNRVKLWNDGDETVRRERVILQGDIDVYLKGLLASKGEVILSNQRLIINTKGGLETRLFASKSLETPLMDIFNISFSQINNKLTVESAHGQITVGGPLANRLHSAMLGLEGSDIEELEANLLCFDVMLYKGAAIPAQKGELTITATKVMFSPISALDTITGATLLTIDFENIIKVSSENNLKIFQFVQNKILKVEFMSQHGDALLQHITERLVDLRVAAPFTDIRSSEYIPEDAKEQAIQQAFPFNHEAETPLLVSWCVILKSDNVSQCAWVMLTDTTVRIISKKKKMIWTAPNIGISKIENRRQGDRSVQMLFNGQRLKLIPALPLDESNPKLFNQFFWKKIKESKPSEAEQMARGNQPVIRLVGMTDQLIFSHEDENFLVFNDVLVEKKKRGLQIEGHRVLDFPLNIGERISLEFPKEDGRFRCTSIITEMYLREPDPVGRYYLTIATPQNIQLFNDRASYRAPFTAITTLRLFLLPDYDTEREDPSTFLGESRLLQELEGQLQDISSGGCGVFISESVKALDIPVHQLYIEFDLELSEHTIRVRGIIKYETTVHSMPNMPRIGCEFFSIPNLERSFINREVLRIEREQIRKNNERKEIREMR